jgi:hypothetical protein
MQKVTSDVGKSILALALSAVVHATADAFKRNVSHAQLFLRMY